MWLELEFELISTLHIVYTYKHIGTMVYQIHPCTNLWQFTLFHLGI